MNANGISNPNRIYSGQKLCIPGDYAPPPPDDGCAYVHVVQRGQTLSGIARYYGVSLYAIMQANNIYNANKIYVGQKLCIPGTGGPVYPPPVDPCYPYGCQPPPPPPPDPCYPYGCQPPPVCPPYPCPPVEPPPPPPPVSQGPWYAEYYNNSNLSGGVATAYNVPQIAFNWGSGGPGSGINGQDFGARFTREEYLNAGTYRFYATSDDGVRVFVNDQLVIDGWKVQAPTTYEGDIYLNTGTARIRVEYFQAGGEAMLYVNYTRIG
jgi:LysM repeat protein